jgi:hypothetical protein
MSRVLPLVLTIGLLLMAAPASAIPICPAGSMADYIAFGAAGCQLNSLTFSNFSYSEYNTRSGFDFFPAFLPFSVPAPPSEVSVQPRSDPASLGSGGAGLAFSSLPPFSRWGHVDLAFDVAGPGILRDDLSAFLPTLADLLSPFVSEFANPPGESVSLALPLRCQFPNLNDPHFDPAECPRLASPKAISLAAATPFQQIDIHGEDIGSVQTGFATPEPATLLLVGTGAAGVGLARWWKRRRAHGPDHAP